MARLVDVDRAAILRVADAVDSYCGLQKRKMRSMDSTVKSMVSSGWVGADAEAFLQQWENVDNDASTATRLQKTLENYAASLRACEEAYRLAQRDLVNASWTLW